MCTYEFVYCDVLTEYIFFSLALQADQNGMESPTEDTANQEDRSKHGDITRKKSGLYQNYCYRVFSAGFASGPDFTLDAVVNPNQYSLNLAYI